MQRYYLAIQARFGFAPDLSISLALLCRRQQDPTRLANDVSAIVMRHAALSSLVTEHREAQTLCTSFPQIFEIHRAGDAIPRLSAPPSERLLQWYAAHGANARLAMTTEALRNLRRTQHFDLFSQPPVKGDIVVGDDRLSTLLLPIHHPLLGIESCHGVLDAPHRSRALRGCARRLRAIKGHVTG